MLLFFPFISGQAQNTDQEPDVRANLQDTVKKNRKYFLTPFADSMRNDSLRAILASKFQIHPPEKKNNRVQDPFDPFIKENYIRKGIGKFWFFVVCLLILGLLLYFRNVFPNQLMLRLRSLFNRYHFRELVSDFGLSFTSASVVAGLISNLILSQAIVVIVVFSGYHQLNSTGFYVIVLLGLILWRVLVFFLQSLEAYVLEIRELSRTQVQRQINLDLGFSLLLFPFLCLAYYNASLLSAINVALVTSLAITLWIGLRILAEFLAMIRESGFTLSGILYFCAFEILPHAVLLTALFRRYS